MSNNIHSSAVIDPKAEIAEGVEIGPFCVVGENVKLGKGTKLHSHVVVEGRTTIGENCEIFPFASIGHQNQDLKYAGEPSELIIGNNNKIREYATMQPGTKDGGMLTKVGNNGLYMVGIHIAHDCIVGDNVIMANNATLGGHVKVGDNVLLGGLSAVHQWIRIGDNAVIGGMSGVESDVIPYGRVKGDRAYLAGLNLIGLERRGFDRTQIKNLQRVFNLLFGGEGTFEQRLEEVEQDFASDSAVTAIIEFVKNKNKFPLCQPKAA